MGNRREAMKAFILGGVLGMASRSSQAEPKDEARSGVVQEESGHTAVADGASSLNGDSAQLFSQKAAGAVTRTLASKLNDYVSAYDFGAKIDGLSDDHPALSAALKHCASTGKTLHIPPGVAVISKPLPFLAAIRGDGMYTTRIRAARTFSGTAMIDTNNRAPGKRIECLTLDGNGVAKCVGSSGDAEGSSYSKYDQVRFASSPNGTYAVGGASSTAVPGMLTGCVFDSCVWDGCSSWVECGQNQDDVTFIGCRFNPTTANNTSTPFATFMGQNINLIGCYVALGKSSFEHAGIVSAIQIGAHSVNFRGIFLETSRSTNLTHIFSTLAPNVVVNVDGLSLNLVNAPSLVALFRTGADGALAEKKQFQIKNLGCIDRGAYAILDVPTAAQDKSSTQLDIANVEDVSNLIVFEPRGGESSTAVAVTGFWRGLHYAHYARPGSPITYQKIDGPDSSFNLSPVVTTFGPSPRRGSYMLTGPGQWLVSVAVRLRSDSNNMAAALYLVDYETSTGQFLAAQQLGATKQTLASEYGAFSIGVEVPTPAGLLALTCSWTSGRPAQVVFAVQATKLNGYGNKLL